MRQRKICINPFRQERTSDATVTAADVASARLISFGDAEQDWLEIITKDGRTITTELRKHQSNIETLINELYDAGILVLKVNDTRSYDHYRAAIRRITDTPRGG
jgi:hypothetical protein